jgi:hypothetical protein
MPPSQSFLSPGGAHVFVFLECSTGAACRQRFLDPGPKTKVFAGPGEFDIPHGNRPGITNVITANFEDHGSLFDGVWEVRTHGSFVGETHRMKAGDKAAALLPVLESLNNRLLFQIA